MKKLSQKDRILLIVCGLIIVIITSYYGWFFWPWFGGTVFRSKDYNWTNADPQIVHVSNIPSITNYSSYSSHELFRLFRDIALRREGDDSIHTIYKWTNTIELFITGNPAEEDLSMINDVCNYLNSIQGFPGIHITSAKEDANITMLFTDGNNGGATGYFYVFPSPDKGTLTKINIYIRNSLSRDKKNSVIWEELLQSTGPMNDTRLTSDTLFYKGKEDIPFPSELDHTILEMLYHPSIKPGMNYLQCLCVFWLYYR